MLAQKPAVDEALRELEGVIKKVASSGWAAQIVTPVKKDGSVRVCGDFKVTINLLFKVDEYPLPYIDYIYAHLAGEGHCSASLTCITITYKWRLRSTPSHSSPLTEPAVCTSAGVFLMLWLPYVCCGPWIISTMEEHLNERLAAVSKRLEEYGLKAN